MAKELPMNHAEIDPSLCSGGRSLDSLDDGFSPPPAETTEEDSAASAAPADAEPALSTKSPF
jgi:hypothetical protein